MVLSHRAAMFRLLFAAVLFALSFPIMAIEEPKYRIVETIGKVELRDYEPTLLAEVEVSGERSAAINQAFRILAGYIFGGNQRLAKIAMTAPVTQAPEPSRRSGEKIAMTAPVTQETLSASGGPRWRVAFMMPSQYTLETLPKPNDAQIRFRLTPPIKRAVIVFDGYSTQSNLEKHREQLQAFVNARQLKIQGEYSLAFYNDPFTLPWNRRNEWWIAIE